MEKKEKKRIIKKYIFISFITFAFLITILLTIKYNVEGERNMPFELSKITIKSTLDATNNESENLWDINLSQNNDIVIYINKNNNSKSDEKIKAVRLINKYIDTTPIKGNVKMYLPTSNEKNKTYLNHAEDCMATDVEYIGNTFNNYERREIAEDGGQLAFRISNENIATYVSNDDLEVVYNKSLFEKAGVSENEIIFSTKLDLIIETTKNTKYKGTINLELPVGNFENSGIVSKEITDFSNVVFKREK